MASEAKQDSTFNVAKQLYAEQFGDAIRLRGIPREIALTDEPAEEKAHEEEGPKPRRVSRALGRERQAVRRNEQIFDQCRREDRGEHARSSPREPGGEGRCDVKPTHG